MPHPATTVALLLDARAPFWRRVADLRSRLARPRGCPVGPGCRRLRLHAGRDGSRSHARTWWARHPARANDSVVRRAKGVSSVRALRRGCPFRSRIAACVSQPFAHRGVRVPPVRAYCVRVQGVRASRRGCPFRSRFAKHVSQPFAYRGARLPPVRASHPTQTARTPCARRTHSLSAPCGNVRRAP